MDHQRPTARPTEAFPRWQRVTAHFFPHDAARQLAQLLIDVSGR